MEEWRLSSPAGRDDVLMREMSPEDASTERSQVASTGHTLRARPHGVVHIGLHAPASQPSFSGIPIAPISANRTEATNSADSTLEPRRRPSNIAITPLVRTTQLGTPRSIPSAARTARLSASPYPTRSPTPVSAFHSMTQPRRPITPFQDVNQSGRYAAIAQSWSAASSGGFISQHSLHAPNHPGPRRFSSDSEQIRRLPNTSGMDLLADAAFLSPKLDITFSPSPPPINNKIPNIIHLVPTLIDSDMSFIDPDTAAYRILESNIPLPIPTLTSLTSMRTGHSDVRDIISLDPTSFESPLAQPRYQPNPQPFLRPVSQLGDIKPFPISDIDAYITQQFLRSYQLFYLRALQRELGELHLGAEILRRHWLSHNTAMIKSVDVARHIKIAYSNSLGRVRLENNNDEARLREIISPLFKQVQDLYTKYSFEAVVLPLQQLGIVSGELTRLIPFCLPCDGLTKIPYIQLDPSMLNSGVSREMKDDGIPTVPHTAPLPDPKTPTSDNEREVLERTRKWAESNSSAMLPQASASTDTDGRIMWGRADEADIKLVIPSSEPLDSERYCLASDASAKTPISLASVTDLSIPGTSAAETCLVIPCHRHFFRITSRALQCALASDSVFNFGPGDHIVRLEPVSEIEGDVIYLKGFDFAALTVILRWMYLRDDAPLIQSMKDNLVSWQNLARTVKMLDMIDPIKSIIGNWWRKWVKVDARRASGHTGQILKFDRCDPTNDGGEEKDDTVILADVEERADEADWELDDDLASAMAGL